MKLDDIKLWTKNKKELETQYRQGGYTMKTMEWNLA